MAVVGVLAVDRIPGLGRLPGDLLICRERWSLYVPITTFLVISLLLTVLLNVFRR